ncbi:hypothetical protein [Ilumatobacter fluminis]|uniref:hypothetical protein n=1 Tax=Ilumatobacter fluminis TaxID=467091 RepID=UPI00105BC9EE|nr:hypothetical protein [Ilumatobacter fluminis]
MAASEKRTKKPKPTRWYSGDSPSEDLDPVEQVAHRIVQESRYLAPSVDRIMDADLTPSQRLAAINLFSASLVDPDAGHRDPRAAIEAARESVD